MSLFLQRTISNKKLAKSEAQVKTVRTKSHNKLNQYEAECARLRNKVDAGEDELHSLRIKWSDSRAEVRACRRKINKAETQLHNLQKDYQELQEKFEQTEYDLVIIQADCRNKTLAPYRDEVKKLRQKIRNIKTAEKVIQLNRQKTKSLHKEDKIRAKTRLAKKQLIAQIEKLQRKIEASKDIEYRRELEERVRLMEENDKHNRNKIEVLKEQV